MAVTRESYAGHACLACLVTALVTALAGCAAGRLPSAGPAPHAGPMPVPAALRPPDGQVLALAVRGVGVQIYECIATQADPARFAWSLQAPEAQLENASGGVVGRHYAGPTWEALDGSKVVGEVVARDPGPDSSAIPWLLLRAKSNSGEGVFAAIASVQRLHTTGGVAPAAGCDPAHAGNQSRIPYSANYDFYASRQ